MTHVSSTVIILRGELWDRVCTDENALVDVKRWTTCSRGDESEAAFCAGRLHQASRSPKLLVWWMTAAASLNHRKLIAHRYWSYTLSPFLSLWLAALPLLGHLWTRVALFCRMDKGRLANYCVWRFVHCRKPPPPQNAKSNKSILANHSTGLQQGLRFSITSAFHFFKPRILSIGFSFADNKQRKWAKYAE